MARPSKVWHRADVGWWMVTIGGKKVRLVKGPNDRETEELAREKWAEETKRRRLSPECADSRVADVVDAYLQHSRVHCAPDTHRIGKWYLQQFVNALAEIQARDLRPFHVERWL